MTSPRDVRQSDPQDEKKHMTACEIPADDSRASIAMYGDDDEEELPLEPAAGGDLELKPAARSTPLDTEADAEAVPSSPDTTAPTVGPADAADVTEAAMPPGVPDAVTSPAISPEGPPVEKKNDAPGTDPDEEQDEAPMTLLEHLGELRRRLTRIVIIVLLGFVACYGIAEPVFNWLAQPLTSVLPADGTLKFDSPQGLFFVYLKVALVVSLFATSPFSFYQIWAFIAPGLYKEEKQAVLPLAFFSAFFFIAGATFCYFLVFPVAFKFFMGFATDTIVPMISVDQYLSFTLKLLIAFGLVFEMPLFAHFLARMRVLTPDMMRRQRKYAILIIFIVAAILTPPDVFSQCLMAGPMLLLYEISIFVAAAARPRKKAEVAENSSDDREEKA